MICFRVFFNNLEYSLLKRKAPVIIKKIATPSANRQFRKRRKVSQLCSFTAADRLVCTPITIRQARSLQSSIDGFRFMLLPRIKLIDSIVDLI